MADVTHILDWLRQALPRNYVHFNRVFEDVAGLLNQRPHLRPKTDVFVHEHGGHDLLLTLTGLLPITYRNSRYKIPFQLWMPLDYPNGPPLVFVTPTKSMTIKRNSYVDPNGRVYHPYLAYWNDRQSSLELLLNTLEEVFSQDPPVRAVAQSSSLSNSTAPPPPAPPPRVQELTSSMAPSTTRPESSNSSRSGSPGPPPRPAKISREDAAPSPPMSPSSYRDQSPAPPPLPPHPPSSTTTTTTDASSASARTSMSHVAPPPLPHHPPSQPPLQSYYRHAQLSPRPLHPSSPRTDDAIDLHRNTVHAKLLSALDKVAKEQRDRWRREQEEANTERDQLLAVESALEQESQDIDLVIEACNRNCNILERAIADAKTVMDSIRNVPEPEVDEIIQGQTILYNQLLNVVAEDLAIEDTIYILGRALEADRVDLDSFMKSSRSLAREQFLKRALALRIASRV